MSVNEHEKVSTRTKAQRYAVKDERVKGLRRGFVGWSSMARAKKLQVEEGTKGEVEE
jgi:hypothetical protein